MRGTIISWQGTPTTIILCILCLLVTYPFLNLGYVNTIFNALAISQYTQGLSEIRDGQFWRLITPIFMHGSWWHFIFNIMNLVIFGSRIELAEGQNRYVMIVLFSAVGSNFAQWLTHGPVFFGISGVVMALIGFLGVRQWRYPDYPFFLPKAFYIFVFVYILAGVLGVFSVLGINMANTAHIVGLLIGMALAFTPPRRRKS